MNSLSIEDLEFVKNFMGLQIDLEDSNGYVLDQEVMIVFLLKGFVMELANGIRISVEDECNMDDKGNLDYLPARGAKGEPSVKSFQSRMESLLLIA